jgi:hypothetical protein
MGRPSVDTDKLNRAVKAYAASLPVAKAIEFAARIWTISPDEARQRLQADGKQQTHEPIEGKD